MKVRSYTAPEFVDNLITAKKSLTPSIRSRIKITAVIALLTGMSIPPFAATFGTIQVIKAFDDLFRKKRSQHFLKENGLSNLSQQANAISAMSIHPSDFVASTDSLLHALDFKTFATIYSQALPNLSDENLAYIFKIAPREAALSTLFALPTLESKVSDDNKPDTSEVNTNNYFLASVFVSLNHTKLPVYNSNDLEVQNNILKHITGLIYITQDYSPEKLFEFVLNSDKLPEKSFFPENLNSTYKKLDTFFTSSIKQKSKNIAKNRRKL